MFETMDIIEMVSPYIYTIIYLFVILFIVAKFKRRVKDGTVNNAVKKAYTDTNALNRNTAAGRNRPAANAAAPVNKADMSAMKVHIQSDASGRGMSLSDDRSSDWLARQLKEEERAMSRVSDMFQLKREHASSCDAEFIKRFHESYCDANGVDDGLKK